MSQRKLPPLNAIRAFDAAARNGGFRAAALELNVTHGVVGQHVRGLEERLGVQLFTRNKRGVELTEAGWLYAERISESLQDIAAATDDLCGKFGTERVHIRAIAGVASKLLVPLAKAMAERFPSLTIVVEPFTDIEDWEVGDADFAIAFGKPGDLEGECDLLFHQDFFPVCAPAYRAEKGPFESARDLLEAHLLHEDYGDWWRAWFARNGIRLRQRARSVLWNASQTIEAALDAQGVALASQLLVGPDLAAGRLVRLPGKTLDEGAYWLVWREKKPRAGRALEVATWIRSEIERSTRSAA